MSNSKSKSKKCCCRGARPLPNKVYARLVYSSTSPQRIADFPGNIPGTRDVVEFNQSPITKCVTHPVDEDFSKFKVHNTGIYKISWLLNTVSAEGAKYYLTQGALTLQINGEVSVDRPQHFGSYTFSLDSFVVEQGGGVAVVARPQISGQDLVCLNAGDVLQLRYRKAITDPSVDPNDGLFVDLTSNFFDPSKPASATFNCVGADLILERVDA